MIKKIDSCQGFSIDTTIGYFMLKKFGPINRIIIGNFNLKFGNYCKDLVMVENGFINVRY